jgi:hydroxymethylpyrimidine/phosphomethylpyrimidine kinase
MVDINIIRSRKSQYGSNFDAIKEKWEKYFEKELECTFSLHNESVAKMMALMKEARIEAIKEKLNDYDGQMGYVEESQYLFDLEESLIDSKTDYANYLWIAENFEKYEKL